LRLVNSLAWAAAARRQAGLGDEAADLQSQLKAAKEDAALWSDRLDTAYRRWPVDRYGGQSQDQFNAIIGRYQSNLVSAQNAVNTLEGKIANLAAVKASEKAVEEANKPAPAPTAAEVAKANRDYVTQQLSLVELARGGQYDFGRGGHLRTIYYRSSGLGGNMQNLLNLNRSRLDFDVFGAIKAGAEEGLQKYRAQAPAGSLPALRIDNPLKGALPDWLAKAQLPLSVRTVGGSVANAVYRAARAKPASGNANAVAPSTVAAEPELADDGPNLLLLGGGAALLGWGLYKALK
jgi:hypothetical protein